MKLSKIYVEITNRCNLNCSFCIHNKRKVRDMSFDEYKIIVDKIKEHTKEIYLHVLGEPLIHKNINEFIDYANDNGLFVNVTTNGYLINNIYNNKSIHRLNVSLHSYNGKIDIDNYLNNIFNYIDLVRDNTFVSLRLWVSNKYSSYMLNYINKRYSLNILDIHDDMKVKITNNLIIDTNHEFIWPDLNNNYYNENGTCKGLRDHIGILSDGTIVPCCLDSLGIIKLGNIYEDSIDDIFSLKLVKDMKHGFENNKKVHELCKHCSFLKDNS